MNINRTAAAGALAALLAAGGGLAAVASGAIALDGATAGAAIVTHAPGTRIVTLQPGELHSAATDPTYDEQICSDPWLAPYMSSCTTQLQRCAQQWERTPATVIAEFTDTGRLLSCRAA
jgi:hypothetical protein